MVDLRSFGDVENVARTRIEQTLPEIRASLAFVAQGNPLAAEPEESRRLNRLRAKTGMGNEEAALISQSIEMAAWADAGKERAGKAAGPEAIWGSTLDFVGVAFLERGRRAADAVGRVAFLNDQPQGTGFLVAPGLFLTNHHVIESAGAAGQFQVQFDYEYDASGRARTPTSFVLDPEACFVTDGIDGLDFTLVGIGERRFGTRPLEAFGHIPLSDAADKHMLGETANLIQHPDGRLKEVVLRENRLVARDETQQVLHYVADTEPGSSGSPVFNNEWEPIALHHWGGPWREVVGTDGQPLAREINEGIRISAIVRAIVRALRDARLAGEDAAAVRRALALWDSAPRPATGSSAPVSPVPESSTPPAAPVPGARYNADGSVTWTFPIEINVRAPLMVPAAAAAATPPGAATALPSTAVTAAATAEAASWKTESFEDRGGYEPGFIPGFVVPLPDYSGAGWRAADNLLAGPGDDPHELPYHHFSIVMNAERRLAGFTAVNIDGKRIKAVDRDTKAVRDDPTLQQLGVESLGREGAEASDAFRPDRRVALEEQMNREFYENQVVKGFLDTKSKARTARIFQKGHIVLRGDPAWGTAEEAVAAERDTFFYTNAAPQVGFFNQGSALDHPGSKGKLRWRAVETYVLRNAVTMKRRISVFAGPVFSADDPRYRFDSQVPMRFWKLAVWSDGTALRSIALLADQRSVLTVMPEAFGDTSELARVDEFLSSVTEIEALTGLDFGAEVRAGDLRAGEAAAPADSLDDDAVGVTPKRAAAAARKRPLRKR